MDNQRRVALFATIYLQYSQTFVYEEMNAHERYEVEVFSKRSKNLDRFPFNKVNLHSKIGKFKGSLLNALYASTTYSPYFMKLLREGNFSLIHAQFGPSSIYALPYASALNLPLVVTYGGYDVPLLNSHRRFKPAFWRYWARSGAMLRRTDLFLPVSKDLANKLIDLGAPAEKVKVFHRGVFIPDDFSNRLYEKGSTFKVLMIGRFVEKKGFEYGIEAFANLLKSNSNASLTIIGDGPLKNNYMRIINSLGIEEKVVFKKNMPQKEIFSEMLASDLLLVPSIVASNGDTEGITNVLKEANCRAVPAVISRHGGNPEIVDDGKTGFIVEERDVAGITKAMIQLSENPSIHRKMGLEAREKIKQMLDFKITNRVLEKLYDKVIEEKRNGTKS